MSSYTTALGEDLASCRSALIPSWVWGFAKRSTSRKMFWFYLMYVLSLVPELGSCSLCVLFRALPVTASAAECTAFQCSNWQSAFIHCTKSSEQFDAHRHLKQRSQTVWITAYRKSWTNLHNSMARKKTVLKVTVIAQSLKAATHTGELVGN